jgi:DNA primase
VLSLLRALYRAPVVVPSDWAEVERLRNVLFSARETVEEMLNDGVITWDQLLDLKNILTEGIGDEDHPVAG